MEQYILKLSECQQLETSVREQREALLKRHEKELEELDLRMADISQQRNRIIDEFKQYLDTNNIAHSQSVLSSASDSSQVGTLSMGLPKNPSKEHLNTSSQSSNKDTSSVDAVGANQCAYKSKQTDDSGLKDKASSTAQVPVPSTKPNRAFRIVHRLTTSNSAGSLPVDVSCRGLESPTTTQIESLLGKVRDNVHSLDNSTLNKCIDLLSARIFKDKEKAIGSKVSKSSVEESSEKEPKSVTPSAKLKPTELPGDEISQKVDDSRSPKQPSSPKKRIETPEERRRRIERVLFSTDPSNRERTFHSQSTLSLNEIGLLSGSGESESSCKLRSSASLNRYGNRSSSNRAKIKRNHSLSPLRFREMHKSKSEEQPEPDDDSQADEELRDDVIGGGTIRRYKSEQQLCSDELSLASFDEDSLAELNAEVTKIESNSKEEEDHLLAPSKVAKSQELFTQVFFPSDVRERPLLSKDEINKQRNVKKDKHKKRQPQSTREADMGQKLRPSSQMEEEVNQEEDHDDDDDDEDQNSASLRIDYLSHLRHSSASPEQRQRERELSSLNNTKKFRCYQDFWEHKTKQILDKKKKFEQWQQASSTSNVASQPVPTITRRKKSPQPTAATIQRSSDTNVKRGISRGRSEEVVSNNSEKLRQRGEIEPKSKRNSMFVDCKASEEDRPRSPRKSGIDGGGQSYYLEVPTDTSRQKSPSPASGNSSDVDDKLLEKLRHLQQDIRHRKMKHQQRQQQQQQNQQLQQTKNGQNLRKMADSSKSLDLQYYPLQHKLVQPKSATVRIVEPNSPEIPGKNRIRLIRSYSRDDPDEPVDLLRVQRGGTASPPPLSPPSITATKATTTAPTALSLEHSKLQTMKEAELRKAFPDIVRQANKVDLISVNAGPRAPMRSTYF